MRADGAARYFELVRRRALEAERRAAVREIDYEIGARRVRLRMLGERLAPVLTRALDHLRRAPGAAPDLAVTVWDRESTGIDLPPPQWCREAYLRHGEVEGYSDGCTSTFYQADLSVLSTVNSERGEGFYFSSRPATIPYWEVAAPMRPLLNRWLSREGRHVVHAAAVAGDEGRAVLLVGPGGSGKSSSALACLGSSLEVLADDYCIVSAGSEPAVYSLYNTAKLLPGDLDRHPLLAGKSDDLDPLPRPKATFFLAEHFPRCLGSRATLAAIVCPAVRGAGRTFTEPISRADAMRALTPSSMSQTAGTGRETFHGLARVIARLPAFRLHLGGDLSDVPGALSALLGSLAT